MNPHALGVLTLCLLLGPGLALNCTWDSSIDPDQVQDGDSGFVLGEAEALDPQRCQEKCCAESDCDVAVVGYPADGGPQCELWSCGNQNQNQNRQVCVFRRSSQFQVFRKQGKKVDSSPEKLHILPLLSSTDPPSNHVLCRLPVKVGLCRAAFPRFFYNVTEQKCRSFVYGGCEANGNNFESEDECESTCSGVTGSVLPPDSTPPPVERHVKAARMVPAVDTSAAESEPAVTESVHPQYTDMSADEYAERCGAEPQAGPCRAAFQHWFYNRHTGTCQSFIYGGCRGNKNNYISEESCMAACTVSVLPSSKKSADDVSTENKDECLLTPDPGPCRAAFPKFFFNHNTGTCQSFLYGGCHGNLNRYGTLEECMSHCSQDGSFDTRGKSRNRWTAAFFLFITLAAISALLLVTLVLVSLRRHRLSHRPSISDKEELLPSDQSSVESLTPPESPRPDQA
ncbi:kunitz-type protease inhibitor 2 isoform X1 [Hippoglossus stenolepis]|uniref:kunitz-type protease inhibitor 2 isoform X1 n=1 Tax=Hippoglossus stenolepis TaxID=195615 RepID=UPI001FAF7939|nr:kunitz-type protease inhibitor 2 isoform X1 [Hippoglossus stenolepis]